MDGNLSKELSHPGAALEQLRPKFEPGLVRGQLLNQLCRGDIINSLGQMNDPRVACLGLVVASQRITAPKE